MIKKIFGKSEQNRQRYEKGTKGQEHRTSVDFLFFAFFLASFIASVPTPKTGTSTTYGFPPQKTHDAFFLSFPSLLLDSDTRVDLFRFSLFCHPKNRIPRFCFLFLPHPTFPPSLFFSRPSTHPKNKTPHRSFPSSEKRMFYMPDGQKKSIIRGKRMKAFPKDSRAYSREKDNLNYPCSLLFYKFVPKFYF